MTELIKSNWNYILYRSNDKLLLTVICGSVGLFERNIYLNELERESYEIEGKSFIERLAEQIRNNPNQYESRHIKIKL